MDNNSNNECYNNCFFENITNYEAKKKLAEKIAGYVKDGDIIGVGSGSTSYIALCEIAKKIKENNLNIVAIPTSYEIKMKCVEFGIPTATLSEKTPMWSFDGADEVDNNGWLIKGRGAAMFKEKLNIVNSKQVYILVDSSKLVDRLCQKNPIPVECYPDAVNYIKNELYNLGAKEITLRLAEGKDGPVITENGNIILDTVFENVESDFETKLKSIVGVFETGLFIGYKNITIESL